MKYSIILLALLLVACTSNSKVAVLREPIIPDDLNLCNFSQDYPEANGIFNCKYESKNYLIKNDVCTDCVITIYDEDFNIFATCGNRFDLTPKSEVPEDPICNTMLNDCEYSENLINDLCNE